MRTSQETCCRRVELPIFQINGWFFLSQYIFVIVIRLPTEIHITQLSNRSSIVHFSAFTLKFDIFYSRYIYCFYFRYGVPNAFTGIVSSYLVRTNLWTSGTICPYSFIQCLHVMWWRRLNSIHSLSMCRETVSWLSSHFSIQRIFADRDG